MKNNYKFWIVLSFLAVFAAGLVSGVILEKNILKPKSDRHYRDSRRADRPHFPTVDEWGELLKLSTEQQEKLQLVFQQNEERIKQVRKDMYDSFRKLRDQFLEEIKAVLDPEQIKQFDAILEEYHAKRLAEAEKRKQRLPDPKRKEEEK